MQFRSAEAAVVIQLKVQNEKLFFYSFFAIHRSNSFSVVISLLISQKMTPFLLIFYDACDCDDDVALA